MKDAFTVLFTRVEVAVTSVTTVRGYRMDYHSLPTIDSSFFLYSCTFIS
jgi:hypothetical protein